jgi:hypothetical protein
MMRRLGFAAVMVAATAGAMPNRRDFPPEPCTVAGKRQLAFGDRMMNVPVPLYDKAKPLGAVCTEKRSVVITQKSIFVLPGYEVFGNRYEVDADIALRQDIPLAEKSPITAWALAGDTVHFMTRDGMYWETGLYEKGLLGYGLPDLKGGSDFAVMVSGGVAFVSQENANGNCLLAIEPGGARLRVKHFSFDSCEGAGFQGADFAADGKRYSITVQNGVDGTYVARIAE